MVQKTATVSLILEGQAGLLRFQNTVTTKFQKTSFTQEIDYYSYKKLPDKNSGFKNLEKSGRVATLDRLRKSMFIGYTEKNASQNQQKFC